MGNTMTLIAYNMPRQSAIRINRSEVSLLGYAYCMKYASFLFFICKYFLILTPFSDLIDNARLDTSDDGGMC